MSTSSRKKFNDTDHAIAIPPPHRTAIFLDIDGTLLEIAPTPADVVADAALIAMLGALRDAVDGALALVSGRAIADIDRLFAPLTLAAGGAHGAEIRFPDGSRSTTSPSVLDFARPPMRALATAHAGLMLEDKGAALALHYRQRPELEPLLVERVGAFGAGDSVATIRGKCVVELVPSRVDKGAAIARLMAAPPFRGRTPVFFGDDVTDEDGFAVVEALGGLTARVGLVDRPTRARATLASPASLRAVLTEYARSVQAKETAR